MRLIKSTFGLDNTDPIVPSIEFLGSRHDEELDRSFLGWCSGIAAFADEGINDLNFSMRAEATVEHTPFACGMSPRWRFDMAADDTLIVMTVEVGGPAGWHERLQPSGSSALAARASEILTTGWAVWHASGFARDQEHLMGILWLTAGGFEWDEALMVSASVVGM